MTTSDLHFIYATNADGVIGIDGDKLPWRLKGDLRHFRRTTMDHVVIMGRKTWDTLPNGLPGRVPVILSKKMRGARGVHVARDPERALALARRLDATITRRGVVFVAGGAQVYRALAPHADAHVVTLTGEPLPEGAQVTAHVPWAEWRAGLTADPEPVATGQGWEACVWRPKRST